MLLNFTGLNLSPQIIKIPILKSNEREDARGDDS